MTTTVDTTADRAGRRSRNSSGTAAPAASAGSSVKVLFVLARREGWRLVRHPAVVIGVALTVWLLWTVSPNGGSWWHDSIEVVLVLVPLGWCALIAGNLSALRSRRYRTDELFASLPVAASVRTAAHALSATGTAVVAAIMLAVWMGMHALTRHPAGSGPVLGEVGVAVLIVGGGTVVGVAVARWLPRALFVIPAILATAVIAANTLNSLTAPSRWLGFWVEASPAGLPEITPRPTAWHLVWVAAWVVIMGAVAVARHGRSRALVATALVAVAVASLAGWAQTRSPSEGELNEMAAILARPEPHQVCAVHGSVTYCAYPSQKHRIAEWRPVVEAVLAAAPAHLGALQVRQRPGTIVGNPHCAPAPYLDVLPPALRDRLDPNEVWAADGGVHPPIAAEGLPCGSRDVRWLFTAVQTGAWAVGLPPAPWGLDERCAADGQARAVVALWLGAQAVPDGASRLQETFATVQFDAEGRVAFGGPPELEAWDTHPQLGVRWHRSDVEAALALLERPPADVRTVLAEHWAQVTDPGTSTAELLSLAGLDPTAALASTQGDCVVPPSLAAGPR